MRRFRRLFALLFILSLSFGVVHEISHSHHSGEVCEVCVLAHAPALLNDTSTVVWIEQFHSPFILPQIALPTFYTIPTRSRSPPIS